MGPGLTAPAALPGRGRPESSKTRCPAKPRLPRFIGNGVRSAVTRTQFNALFSPACAVVSAVTSAECGIWLRNAAAGLCLLAAAAGVSFTAQYGLIYATRRLAVVAGLEAAIPDAAALVFASPRDRAGPARQAGDPGQDPEPRLGRHQRVDEHDRGRARLAKLAVQAMPPVAYALASDTLIGVVRAGAVARHQDLDGALVPGEEMTPLAVAGGLVLWLLRLALAPIYHPGRVPRLGPGAVPGRPRPPRGPRGPGRRPGRTRPGSRGRARRPAS